MNKLYLIVFINLIAITAKAQSFSHPKYSSSFENTISPSKSDTSFVLTHSSSQIINPLNSVSCNLNEVNYENSYYRVFDLEGFFKLNGDWSLQEVDFGIAQAQSATGTEQPLMLIFYVMSTYNESTIIPDSLHKKGDTIFFNVNNNESGLIKKVQIEPSVSIPLGSVLVVEVFVPDNNHKFFIGSNDLGQTDKTYIRAPECGIENPISTEEILYGDMMLVMNISGAYDAASPEILSFTIAGQLGNTEILNDPDYTINAVMSVDANLSALSPQITVPTGFHINPASGEPVDFSAGSVPYTVTNEHLKISQTWDVSVSNAGPEILSVQIPPYQNGLTIIDNVNYKVTVPVPFETDLTDLIPQITLYDGFNISPESGVSQDFSLGEVFYMVTHETLPLSQEWSISVFEAVTGIKNHEKNTIKVYPNPVNDILNVTGVNYSLIQILDLNGNIIRSGKLSPLNISDLTPGVYILRIYSSDGVYTKKIVKVNK